ncbi:MAG TPA: beta-eliminating lyase-related protein, partial [Ignavibacteriaceae bacterium]|nr:beta-eliminating lyase-related protein [Ignavibacteriaceae bacterium]
PYIRPTSAYYMPRTKVIEIENTHNRAGGTIHPIENIINVGELAKKYSLFYHLDGARIWNASVASKISVKEYASYFDTVSCCLSKGLGAPVGSIIAGSKDFIKEAFRVRKAWGGGTRQIGILAAAGLYALKNNINRLEEDHEKAKLLAATINNCKKLKINLQSVQTNILIFQPVNISIDDALTLCKEKGLLLSTGKPGYLRAITHLDVSFDEIKIASKIIEEVFN